MDLILADTNIVIYILKGINVAEPYLSYDFSLSDISIIELLGVKNIDKNILSNRQKFIDKVFNFPVNNAIKQRAILLKQTYVLKVPDAVIAATALIHNIPLITADKDFKKIQELNAIIISL
jgi:predicted nucleic acid-binding protein